MIDWSLHWCEQLLSSSPHDRPPFPRHNHDDGDCRRNNWCDRLAPGISLGAAGGVSSNSTNGKIITRLIIIIINSVDLAVIFVSIDLTCQHHHQCSCLSSSSPASTSWGGGNCKQHPIMLTWLVAEGSNKLTLTRTLFPSNSCKTLICWLVCLSVC